MREARFYRIDVPLDDSESWVLNTDDSSDLVQFRLSLMRGGRIARADAVEFHELRVPRQPVDFSLSVLGIPVVSPHGREVLERAAPADVEFIPAWVVGRSGSFYVLNILRVLDVIDHDASTFSSYDGPDRFKLVTPVIARDAMSDHRIVRVRGAPQKIVVTREVARALQENFITGCELLPLDSRQ